MEKRRMRRHPLFLVFVTFVVVVLISMFVSAPYTHVFWNQLQLYIPRSHVPEFRHVGGIANTVLNIGRNRTSTFRTGKHIDTRRYEQIKELANNTDAPVHGFIGSDQINQNMKTKKTTKLKGMITIINNATAMQGSISAKTTSSPAGHLIGRVLQYSPKPLKEILIWTDPWRIPVEPGQSVFTDSGCAISNCWVSLDRGRLSKAAAVIFHIHSIKNYMMERGEGLPKQRIPNQYWIIANQESAIRDLSLFNGYFNWTMTYRPKADIYWPYGRVLPVGNSRSTTRVRSYKRQYHFDILPFQKKHMAAWFSSHCGTRSGREDYVYELQKYMPIHIFGKCRKKGITKYVCPPGKGRKQFDVVDTMYKFYCHEMLEAQYKFYLSFENTFCRYYVTEKLFNVMEFDVVPIVLGGANYSEILPPKSYINIFDFKTPKDLAEYVTKLASNESLYMEYFEWKHYHRVEMSRAALNQTFCRLCSAITDPNIKQRRYIDLQRWYSENETICDLNKMKNIRKEGKW